MVPRNITSESARLVGLPVIGAEPSRAASLATQKSIEIILKCVDGHGRFNAAFNGMQIVAASRQPICDAARVLHRLGGYPDNAVLVARHDGAEHEAMCGPLGA